MSRTLQFDAVSIDLARRQVVVAGEARSLTEREVEALLFLAERAGTVVARTAMEQEVWGFRAGVRSQAVPVAMRRLRAKIEPDPRHPVILLTVQGVGWKLVPPHRAAARPPRASFRAPPDFSTPFFERPGLIEDILRPLRQGQRIITVVGPGGVGKTRLAVEAVRRQDLPVCFVDLSPARTLQEANALLLAALDQTDTSRLTRALTVRGPFILLLDNLEHLMERALHWAHRWLPTAPQMRAVCTSREAMGIPGEAVVRVAPMAAASAARFFQARAVDVGARVPDAAALQIAERLDTLPLALELYASHAALFSPAQLIEHLDGGLDLGLQVRGQPRRLSSLASMVEWSWSLLDAEEQALLRDCRVFPGAFTPAGVRALLPGASLSTLASLHRKSLLSGRNGELHLLRTLRAFLDARGPIPPALLEQHAAWAAEQGEAAVARLQAAPDVAQEALDALQADLYQAGRHPSDHGARATLSLCVLLALRGHTEERIRLLSGCRSLVPGLAVRLRCALAVAHLEATDNDAAALALGDADTPEAQVVRARLLRRMGRAEEAIVLLEAVSADAEAAPLEKATALAILASLRSRQGERVDALLQEALVLCARHHLHSLQLDILLTLAGTLVHAGKLQEAEDTLERVLAQGGVLGLRRAQQSANHILGYVLFEKAPHRAVAALERSAAMARQAGDLEREMSATSDLSVALFFMGDLERAARGLDDTAAFMASMGPEMAAYTRFFRALISTDRGLYRSAAEWLEEVDAQALSRAVHRQGAGEELLRLGHALLLLERGEHAAGMALMEAPAQPNPPRVVAILCRHILQRHSG